jgi:hypothetical protein
VLAHTFDGELALLAVEPASSVLVGKHALLPDGFGDRDGAEPVDADEVLRPGFVAGAVAHPLSLELDPSIGTEAPFSSTLKSLIGFTRSTTSPTPTKPRL